MINKNIKIIKKNGSYQNYDTDKIIAAVEKSAQRAMVDFNATRRTALLSKVDKLVSDFLEMSQDNKIPVAKMHLIVEKSLDSVDADIAKSYREYRNYKTDFVDMLNKIYKKAQEMMFTGDRDNANADSCLVSTRRTITCGYLSKELYQRFFLSEEEREAIEKGYLYIHDMSARRDTYNCCNFDVLNVLKDGFEMGNIWYTEPKSLDVAFNVIGDIILMGASQQYGGFTVPEVDKLLAPYAEKTYQKVYKHEYDKLTLLGIDEATATILADKEAYYSVENDMRQGCQGWEMKLNTVASSRGDYPFTAITFGLGTSKWEKLATKTILQVRRNGQGKSGFKKPVLFPKLIFFYTEELHGEGMVNADLFEEAIKTSGNACYPDYVSLDGDTHLSDMYHNYGLAISPMGCRAFLTPWYKRGGMIPADELDEPVFVGRANIGVVSLNLPMIYEKSIRDSKDFFEELTYYLDLIRGIHIKTKNYLGNMRASINPLGFCQGGFYGGHLQLEDKIAPVIESWTASWGITALNELQQLYNQESLAQTSRKYLEACKAAGREEMDGEMFVLDVVKYIESYANKTKFIDHIPYALYGTPAESLCGTQVEQFKKEFGFNDAVTSRSYVSNSFHCHVSEDITGIEKQDLEQPFWKYFKGGRIQYVKYPIGYNSEAMKTLVRRAMQYGYYEGVNLSLSYCNKCGAAMTDDVDTCPCCGTRDLTKIERMNGYLSYSRVHGKTRLNDAKMAEIADRKSM